MAGTTQLSTTELIYLPTASGPMPVAAVINGVHHAVHSDHLNTPRRLSDAAGQTRWQWPYSGYGEIAPQATPAPGQPAIAFDLRYPGQLDDGNGLFYNWNRFYDPRVGRYTSADPIGLEGGWNRFGYVGGNPLGAVDPRGLDNPGMGPYSPPSSPDKIILSSILRDSFHYRWAANAMKTVNGATVVVSHGSPKTVNGINNARQLADSLRARGWDGKTPIILSACKAGQGENSIAEQMHNFTGVKVIAPTESLWSIGPYNLSTPFQDLGGPQGDWGLINPFMPGVWRTFGE